MKIRINIVNALMVLALSLMPLIAEAKPATKRIIYCPQPDGSELAIRKCGDERHHYMLTEDGLPVIQTAAGIQYASVSGDGRLVGSGVLCHNNGARTQAEMSFISGKQPSLAIEALGKQIYAKQTMGTRGPGLMDNFPCHGVQKGLVVLVEYQDLPFKVENPHEYYDRMLNEAGFKDNGHIGSARDYFVENSHGIFQPQFDVYGPVKLKNNMAYYGQNDRWGDDMYAYEMGIEACQQLDESVDFSQYDRDGDGVIDNIYIFYAGYGEADYNSEMIVWPHSYSLDEVGMNKQYFFDGVRLNKYACSNELDGSVKVGFRPDGIGTFVHEFSHVMGLPDLYATRSYTSPTQAPWTPNEYSVLDYGPYNGDGCVPPRYSAYERYALDWMTPAELNSTRNVCLRPIENNVAYILKTARNQEYFLVENRQQNGWDAYLPGHGMLVWHIDYNEQIFRSNIVNNSKSHQYVDLIEADGTGNLETMDSDLFPGTMGITSFSTETKPALKDWLNNPLEITSISDIREDENTGYISFKATKPGDEGNGQIEDLADVNDVLIDDSAARGDIYGIDGVLIAKDADYSELYNLPKGIYIFKGKKIAVK